MARSTPSSASRTRRTPSCGTSPEPSSTRAPFRPTARRDGARPLAEGPGSGIDGLRRSAAAVRAERVEAQNAAEQSHGDLPLVVSVRQDLRYGPGRGFPRSGGRQGEVDVVVGTRAIVGVAPSMVRPIGSEGVGDGAGPHDITPAAAHA